MHLTRPDGERLAADLPVVPPRALVAAAGQRADRLRSLLDRVPA